VIYYGISNLADKQRREDQSSAGAYVVALSGGDSHTTSSRDYQNGCGCLAGLEWLRTNHNAWIEGKPLNYSDEEFSRILAQVAGAERSLRVLHYDGCLLGDRGPCPEDAVMTCDHCAGIPWPPRTAAESNQQPVLPPPGQLALFQPPSPHP
jgi:hypothetical protein